MGNPVMFFEIAGKNGEELCEFYSSLFGWEISPETNNVHMCNTGSEDGIQGIIFPTTDDMPSANHITVYITVDNLEETVRKVESSGGKIVIPPTEIPDGMGSFAWVLDPGGNLLGLHKQ